MLIKFNEQREGAYDTYQVEKNGRLMEETKMGTRKEAKEYGKLYKALGPDNKNKDMRRQLQDEVDMYTDN